MTIHSFTTAQYKLPNKFFLLKIFAFKNNISYLYICTMPIGILFIIQMPAPSFHSAEYLLRRIDAYFDYTDGEFHMEEKPVKSLKDGPATEQKMWDREPQPATFTGLALFLGFNSLLEFEDYEDNGEFASTLRRGRLCIEAVYEKKLHQQSPTGAIFALKNMGWNDKTNDKNEKGPAVTTLKIEFTEKGPKLANSEKEVVL
jgi:hypothetical protein